MDTLIIEKKWPIPRYLNRIESRIPDNPAFLRDFDTQDVVIPNLARAVQMSVERHEAYRNPLEACYVWFIHSASKA
jgi:hypothetical protein